jgi:hypothetical protein
MSGSIVCSLAGRTWRCVDFRWPYCVACNPTGQLPAALDSTRGSIMSATSNTTGWATSHRVRSSPPGSTPGSEYDAGFDVVNDLVDIARVHAGRHRIKLEVVAHTPGNVVVRAWGFMSATTQAKSHRHSREYGNPEGIKTTRSLLDFWIGSRKRMHEGRLILWGPRGCLEHPGLNDQQARESTCGGLSGQLPSTSAPMTKYCSTHSPDTTTLAKPSLAIRGLAV